MKAHLYPTGPQENLLRENSQNMFTTNLKAALELFYFAYQSNLEVE